MLSSISIQNFAIVKELNIDLKSGLNIITGETGAGKSIIIEAISMALGGRADTSYIRNGQDKACITLLVNTDDCNVDDILNDIGAPLDNPLIIKREISQNSKSICRINGSIVPLSSLSMLCKRLVDIHGQYDQQRLLDSDNHIEILDQYGGKEISDLKLLCSENYRVYASNINELNKLKKTLSDSEKQRDYLKFEYQEIRDADLIIGEDDELEESIKLLENSEKIHASLDECYSSVYENDHSAMSILSKALKSIESAEGITKDIDGIIERFSNAYYELDDLDRELRNTRDSISFSESELNEKIERLELINKLKRKYGNSIDQILDYSSKIEKQINSIENADKEILELEKKIKESKSIYDAISKRLTNKRQEIASLLEKAITKELLDLNFNEAKFKVEFKKIDPSINGNELAEFLISANIGSDLQPLAKIVSGGELSRIMLALKRIIGDTDSIPSMIFDEIDTGISGATAAVVGDKLLSIADNHQVLCITHLPQIASKGDTHFRITKTSDEISTSISVIPLGINERIEEIARLLSGSNITNTARMQAKELLGLNG